MFRFIANCLFDEIKLIRRELGKDYVPVRRRQSLRQMLRFLSSTLAQVLSLAPDEMSQDELARLIRDVPDVAPRRLRSRLERIISTGEAEVGA